jgi:hypothetical protein
MMLLLDWIGAVLANHGGKDPVGAARSPRDEGPTGRLPGLAAAAKKQLPHHDRASIAGLRCGTAVQPGKQHMNPASAARFGARGG